MTRLARIIPLALLLGACSRDPALCRNPDAPILVAGRCYSEGAAAGNALGWIVGVAIGVGLLVWWIALFVGIRRDVRRVAEALERMRDE